ncbi:MAG: glycosyltransferase family 39 protein [Rhizobiales bacterium]|nr:glycosyltransferase family 39 protein [Hyphomicrobiales bacterium]MBI3673771.1 glycosyltransferase family 39 protein [Hyphomicrobiales bacterium]
MQTIAYRIGAPAGLNDFWQRPLSLLLLICTYQFAVWTVAPLIMTQGLHVNILSVALWGREWLLVSYKHPNLPGWVFEIAEGLFGYTTVMAYALSQTFVIATLIFVYLLAADILRDRFQALAATALLLGVFYFSVPSIVFNHNIAQMPFWVAFLWLFNRSLTSGGAIYWLLTALTAALSMYAKLSSGLIIALAVVWLAIDPRGRAALRTTPPYIAALAFTVSLVPLAYALWVSGLQPIAYAAARGEKANTDPAQLIAAVAAILIFPAIILWLAGTVKLREIPRLFWPKTLSRNLRFVVMLGLLPIAFCVFASFFASIRILWLTPMFSLWGIYLIGNLGRSLTSQQVNRITVVAIAVNFLAIAGYGTFASAQIYLATTPPRWEDWPQQRIAAELDRRWAERVGAPLRIVAGATHLAGAVAFWSSGEPSFFENLDPSLSPWITEERIARDGMLIVWRPGDPSVQRFGKYLTRYATETLTLPWSDSTRAWPVTLDYLIVAPSRGGANGFAF